MIYALSKVIFTAFNKIDTLNIAIIIYILNAVT